MTVNRTALSLAAGHAPLARRHATDSVTSGRCSTLLLAALALIFALGIYTSYRGAGTQVNVLLAAMFPGDTWQTLRLAVPNRLPLAGFVKGALPGGLWVLAATLIAKGAFASLGAFRLNLERLPVITAVFFELLQWAGATDGTFDPIDLVAELAGWSLAAFWIASQRPSPDDTPTRNWRLALCLFSYAILPLADVRS